MKQMYIHGLGQTPECWAKTIEKLEGTVDRQCVNLAKMLQGKEATYENLYEAFSSVCDENAEPVDLCGLSLGGILALNYAVDHPEKVRSLVLIAAQYQMPEKLLRFQNFLFRFMPKSMFVQMGFQKSDFLTLCRTMMKLDFKGSLCRIDCPVLVVCGDKDSANKKAANEMADILKNAKLQIIPNAGHEVNVEAPEALAGVLNMFFDMGETE